MELLIWYLLLTGLISNVYFIFKYFSSRKSRVVN